MNRNMYYITVFKYLGRAKHLCDFICHSVTHKLFLLLFIIQNNICNTFALKYVHVELIKACHSTTQVRLGCNIVYNMFACHSTTQVRLDCNSVYIFAHKRRIKLSWLVTYFASMDILSLLTDLKLNSESIRTAWQSNIKRTSVAGGSQGDDDGVVVVYPHSPVPGSDGDPVGSAFIWVRGSTRHP